MVRSKKHLRLSWPDVDGFEKEFVVGNNCNWLIANIKFFHPRLDGKLFPVCSMFQKDIRRGYNGCKWFYMKNAFGNGLELLKEVQEMCETFTHWENSKKMKKILKNCEKLWKILTDIHERLICNNLKTFFHFSFDQFFNF